jgi:lipopolysaccharide export system permease protein
MDVREMPTGALLRADTTLSEALRLPISHMLFEGHDRLAQSLFVIFVPLIAAASLMLGAFSRFGVWKQILVAVALVLPMQLVRNAAEASVRADADAWPLAYAQPAVAALVALVMIALAMRQTTRWRGIPA